MTDLPAPFDIAVQTSRDVSTTVRVRVAGEFDGSAVPAFDIVTTRIGDLNAGRVIVDIGAVSLLDSAAIGALMRLRAIVLAQHSEFSLQAPAPFQQRLFSVTGLSHVLDSGDPPQP